MTSSPGPSRRGRPPRERPLHKDMLLVWTERCAKLFRLETGQDCGGCPDYDECQRQADRRIGTISGPRALLREVSWTMRHRHRYQLPR
jgi:hypothetical protein